MALDKHADSCVGPYTNHKWGTAPICISDAGLYSRYAVICQHAGCRRLRITEYTMRGNHTGGYRDATDEEVAKLK
jgi:hypothetical protein